MTDEKRGERDRPPFSSPESRHPGYGGRRDDYRNGFQPVFKDDGLVKSPSAALRGNPAPLDKDLGLREE
jgi:hypothetical protein